MSGSQESRDHHYIPAFYQKQWGTGGKLFAYSRPFKDIVMKSCSPYATGFERDLYALHSYPSPTRAVLEDRVLKQIDQQASDALQSLLEWQGQSLPLKTKVAWARFVLSLHLRHPDSVANLSRLWADDYRNRFDALRRDLPSDVEDWDDEFRTDQGFGMLYSRVLSSAEVITFIIGMQWHTLTVQGAANSFLTSHRPMMRTHNIQGEDGHLVLPLAPSKLFLAVNNTRTFEIIAKRKVTEVIAQANDYVCRAASRQVYADSDRQTRFKANRLGRTVDPRRTAFLKT